MPSSEPPGRKPYCWEPSVGSPGGRSACVGGSAWRMADRAEMADLRGVFCAMQAASVRPFTEGQLWSVGSSVSTLFQVLCRSSFQNISWCYAFAHTVPFACSTYPCLSLSHKRLVALRGSVFLACQDESALPLPSDSPSSVRHLSVHPCHSFWVTWVSSLWACWVGRELALWSLCCMRVPRAPSTAVHSGYECAGWWFVAGVSNLLWKYYFCP